MEFVERRKSGGVAPQSTGPLANPPQPVPRRAFADCDFAEKVFWIFLIDFVIPLHGYESMEVFYGLVTYRVRTWCVRAVRSCLTPSKKCIKNALGKSFGGG